MKILHIHKSLDVKDVSIEKAFNMMTSALNQSFEIITFHVPYSRADLKSLLGNLKAVYERTKKQDFDLVHITGDLHYLTIVLPSKKTVLTIHDLVGTYQFKGVKKFLYILLWVVIPTLKCKSLVAISDYTRNEVFKYAPWTKNHIEVIPSALNTTYYFVPKDFNYDCPRILMVGTRANKNLPRAINALQGLNCILDIVGPLTDSHISELNKNHMKYENGLQLSEDELMKRYIMADIVLFPSLYEGQGLIILEAQKIGRAVVTSNLEPMITVSGGASCLIDPYDIGSIRFGVSKIIDNEKFRNGLIKNGILNIQKYEAPVLAEKYSLIYSRICHIA